MKPHLFVFGTLLSGYDHPMSRKLSDEAELLGPARCNGLLYRVKHYPGMTLSTNPADQVHGEVFRMHDPQGLLAVLDKYEGCAPGTPEPTQYVRREVPVTLDDARTLTVWTYVYNLPVAHLPRIMSGNFLKE